MTPAIRTVDLTRSFDGRLALDGVSMEVGAGEVVALLGPNGAGKSTTVRLLDGVLRPDRGRSEVLGLDPASAGDAVRRRTGVVTELAGLDDRLSPREDLTATAAIRGIRGAEASRRVDAVLERFDLGDRTDRPLRGASTGERKRVALARALLHDPEVLFLDEPTSGLDPVTSRDVLALVADLARTRGCTVVLCTHVLSEAASVAGRVGILRRGRLQALGTQAELAATLAGDAEADVDLGGPPAEPVLAAIRGCRGVLAAAPHGDGVRVRLLSRQALATVVATLVHHGVPVHAAVPRVPTLEDVYFALQAAPADDPPEHPPAPRGAGAGAPEPGGREGGRRRAASGEPPRRARGARRRGREQPAQPDGVQAG